MSIKVLVIGGTGMLGHVVHNYLAEQGNYHLYNTVYRNKLTSDSLFCDVRDQKQIKETLNSLQPNVVINCVGALVNESRENPASAIYLNALLPHLLKDQCNRIGASLIHISTDCVFSGKKGGYGEGDLRDADDVYGRSKALGEIAEAPHCTLRTSIIGPELKEAGTGLLNWFLNQRDDINGYTNVFWSGVTTLELAKQIRKVVDHSLTGLYHITNGGRVSKFDLLGMFRATFPSAVKSIVAFDGYSSDKSLQVSKRYNFNVAAYQTMLNELLDFMKKRSLHYPHYHL